MSLLTEDPRMVHGVWVTHRGSCCAPGRWAAVEVSQSVTAAGSMHEVRVRDASGDVRTYKFQRRVVAIGFASEMCST